MYGQGYSFSCQKLSKIAVHVFAREVVEESLPFVLLSLSAQAIELGSREIQEVAFATHHFAYSILGTMTSLFG